MSDVTSPKLLLIAAPQIRLIKVDLRPATWASSALHSFVARPAETFASLGFGRFSEAKWLVLDVYNTTRLLYDEIGYLPNIRATPC